MYRALGHTHLISSVATRVSKAQSPASAGAVWKYKGDLSNKTTAAREGSMDSLISFSIHAKSLGSPELLGYQDLHLGQVGMPPEPVVSPYLKSLVSSNRFSC